jgi:site-specific DNA-methyltransferase (adenine-specific)
MTPDVRLIHGDCLEILPTLATGSVDAVVTDPPYNVGLNYNSTNDNRSNYREWCLAWFAELKRICNGPIAISVGQSNLSLWASIAPPSWWLAWWKPAAMGRCVVGFNNWEPIALYGKTKKQVCDVIMASIKPDPDLEGHPCPKPLSWGLKQVEMLSNEGEMILDPFLGSGTTGVACLKAGRNFIGIEKDETYFKVAERRIAAERESMPLFTHRRLKAMETPLFAAIGWPGEEDKTED